MVRDEGSKVVKQSKHRCTGYRTLWFACGSAIAGLLVLATLGRWAAAADQPLRPSALAETGPKPKPIDPPAPEEIQRSIHRGLLFLLTHQNKDGSWGSANITRPGDLYAPVPGAHQAFKAAVTAMCISALIETGGSEPDVPAALDRAEDWTFAHLAKVRRATPDTLYNCWTHMYAIQALVRMLGRKPGDADRREKIMALMQHQIGMLDRYELVDGGWAYYDFNVQSKKPSGSTLSFVTAAGLVALREARDAGADVPQRLIDRATASIRRQRNPDFSYLYGEYTKDRPMRLVNRARAAWAARRRAIWRSGCGATSW